MDEFNLIITVYASNECDHLTEIVNKFLNKFSSQKKMGCALG
jgi:hypothetical protein